MGVIAPQSFIKSEVRQMDRNRKKHKFSLPVTVTVGIALALVFYLALSYFLGATEAISMTASSTPISPRSRRRPAH